MSQPHQNRNYGYMSVSQNHPKKHKTSAKRILMLVIVDILIAGAGLCIFSLFHHVIQWPSSSIDEGIVLYTPNPDTTTPSVHTDSGQNDDPQSLNPDTQHNQSEHGNWGAKFADKFTDGEPIVTENSYISRDINISIERFEKDKSVYFIADIYVRDLQNFRTAFAGGSYKLNASETTQNMAEQNDAILAISGEYYSIRRDGIVIRDGVLYRDNLFEDILIMYSDGTMKTYTAAEFDLEAVKQSGPYQGWSFGPKLLDNGQPMQTFNSRVNPKNPRSAVGYYEPGHYCFVLVDGRQPGYSDGMTLKELSQLFYDLGCTEAYNMDGGQTAIMVFMGKMLNQPYHGGRKTGDILYIGEAK